MTLQLRMKIYQLNQKKALDLFKILFQIEPKKFKKWGHNKSEPEKGRLLAITYKKLPSN